MPICVIGKEEFQAISSGLDSISSGIFRTVQTGGIASLRDSLQLFGESSKNPLPTPRAPVSTEIAQGGHVPSLGNFSSKLPAVHWDDPQLRQWGDPHLAQGRYGDAQVLIESLITILPDNPYLYSLLGSVQWQQGALDDAVSSFSKAIDCYPQNISAWTNRGEIYLKQGRLNEAALDLKQAAELDPQGEDAFANRARLLFRITRPMLKLAAEKGPVAVDQMRQKILKQLRP